MRGELKGFVGKVSPYIILICLALAILLLPSFGYGSVAYGSPIIENLTLQRSTCVAGPTCGTIVNATYQAGTVTVNVTANKPADWVGDSSKDFNVTMRYANSTNDWVVICTNTTPINISVGAADNRSEYTCVWDTTAISNINETVLNVSMFNSTDTIDANYTNVTIDNTAPSINTNVTIITNNTVLTDWYTFINITFDEDFLDECILEYDNASMMAAGGVANVTMTKGGSASNGWGCSYNYSRLDDTWNGSNNFSVYYRDIADNLGRTATYFHEVDRSPPNVTFVNYGSVNNYSVANTSTYIYLNITLNYTEWHRDTVQIFIWDNDNTSTVYNITETELTQPSAGHVRLYAFRITNVSNVDGMFTLQLFANDTAGNSVWSSSNHTGLVSHLVGGRWAITTLTGQNDIGSSIGDNITLYNLSIRIPYSEYISRWDNRYEYKNWTTWSRAAPTVNNAINITIARNEPFAIYVNTSVTYFRNLTMNYTDNTNQSIWEAWTNTSGITNRTSQNLIGIADEFDANFTIRYYEGVAAPSATVNITTGDKLNKNVTSISYYNNTAGNYVTCVRGTSESALRYCSGAGWTGQNITSIKIPRSTALWVNSQVNFTWNITRYAGRYDG